MRAVEKFDFARGNKFSTYASWAIMRNFARTIPDEFKYRDRFRTSQDEAVRRRSRTSGWASTSRKRPSNCGSSRSNASWPALTNASSGLSSAVSGLNREQEPKTLKEVGSRAGRDQGADSPDRGPGVEQTAAGGRRREDRFARVARACRLDRVTDGDRREAAFRRFVMRPAPAVCLGAFLPVAPLRETAVSLY